MLEADSVACCGALGSQLKDMESDSESQEAEEIVMALHSSVPAQNHKRKTFKLLAKIGNHQVLILVDSGSVGTFISEQLVQHLKLPTKDC